MRHVVLWERGSSPVDFPSTSAAVCLRRLEPFRIGTARRRGCAQPAHRRVFANPEGILAGHQAQVLPAAKFLATFQRKVLDNSRGLLYAGSSWRVSARFATFRLSRSLCTATLSIICAISAKPWSAQARSRRF